MTDRSTFDAHFVHGSHHSTDSTATGTAFAPSIVNNSVYRLEARTSRARWASRADTGRRWATADGRFRSSNHH